MEVQDIMEDIVLEGQEYPEESEQQEVKRRRAEKQRVRRCPTY